ncbi:MAG: LuxR C-terminal-related transcriptional regulator [Nitrospirae bacterium]|nr:LuxR C-terminal-related transcriptional regulator [Nitrospirota bacterium]
MKDIEAFVFGKMPTGVIVFDRKLGVLFANRRAELFLKRFRLPNEVTTVSRRIFDAITLARVKETIPGEVHIMKKFEDSPNNWIFTVHFCEEPGPFVAVFIVEESLSNKFDLAKIRMQFRLTRRETDVMRRVLNGMKNTEIAEELEIAEQTVKDYLSNIYMKIGVENRFALMSFLLTLAGSEPARG